MCFIINHQQNEKNNNKKSVVRSSSAEYLNFIVATGEGGVDVIYANENIWLSQKMMGTLYNVNVRAISEHLQKIFKNNELGEDSVIWKFRITANDGKIYDTKHYNLSAIQDQLFESDFDRMDKNQILSQ